MGIDRPATDDSTSAEQLFPDAATRSALQALLRGVESFQIPPSIDWPAARQHGQPFLHLRVQRTRSFCICRYQRYPTLSMPP